MHCICDQIYGILRNSINFVLTCHVYMLLGCFGEKDKGVCVTILASTSCFWDFSWTLRYVLWYLNKMDIKFLLKKMVFVFSNYIQKKKKLVEHYGSYTKLFFYSNIIYLIIDLENSFKWENHYILLWDM